MWVFFLSFSPCGIYVVSGPAEGAIKRVRDAAPSVSSTLYTQLTELQSVQENEVRNVDRRVNV